MKLFTLCNHIKTRMSNLETKPISCPAFQHVCSLKFPKDYDDREPEDLWIEWLRFSTSDFLIILTTFGGVYDIKTLATPPN